MVSRSFLPSLHARALMNEDGMTKDAAEAELNYLQKKGGSSKIFPSAGPVSLQEASKDIVSYATNSQWPDPFAPGYPYASPWVPKKDNKGKKERPNNAPRPPVQNV